MKSIFFIFESTVLICKQVWQKLIFLGEIEPIFFKKHTQKNLFFLCVKFGFKVCKKFVIVCRGA